MIYSDCLLLLLLMYVNSQTLVPLHISIMFRNWSMLVVFFTRVPFMLTLQVAIPFRHSAGFSIHSNADVEYPLRTADDSM